MKKALFSSVAIFGTLISVTLLGVNAAAAEDLTSGTNIPASSGFSGVPGVADGGPDLQRSRFTYQIGPGQTVKDFFFVSNVGTEPLDLNVYSADATTTSNGSFDVSESTIAPVDVGNWVSFAGGKTLVRVHLKAGADASIPFTLRIPTDATPGDHAGGIVVGTAPTGSGQIKIERRVVTRLYARVQGALNPKLSVSNIKTTYTPAFNPFDGVLTESFTIVNNGNVSLKAVATAEASGIFGIPLAPLAAQPVTEILPGTSRDYTITISGVGQWIYLASHIKLVPDVDKDALNPGALVTITRDTSVWVFPTTWFIVLVILLTIVVIVRSQVRSRRRKIQQWLDYTEAEARRKAAAE